MPNIIKVSPEAVIKEMSSGSSIDSFNIAITFPDFIILVWDGFSFLTKDW